MNSVDGDPSSIIHTLASFPRDAPRVRYSIGTRRGKYTLPHPKHREVLSAESYPYACGWIDSFNSTLAEGFLFQALFVELWEQTLYLQGTLAQP